MRTWRLASLQFHNLGIQHSSTYVKPAFNKANTVRCHQLSRRSHNRSRHLRCFKLRSRLSWPHFTHRPDRSGSHSHHNRSMFYAIRSLLPSSRWTISICEGGVGLFSGLIVGWSLWLAEWITLAVFPIAFVRYLTYFLPALDVYTQALIMSLFVLFLIITNILGVKATGRARGWCRLHIHPPCYRCDKSHPIRPI